MNDEEFGSLKILTLKHRRRGQIFTPSAEFIPPKKLGLPSLICENFQSLKKVLLGHAECIGT